MLGHTVLFWTIGWHRPERGLKRLLRLSFYRLANCLLLYGTTGQDIGRSLGYPADRMELIYNSFESSLGSERDPVSHSELIGRLPTDGICIGAVVRLNPVKQLNLIIEAASVLGSRGQDVNVLLVGEGPARDDLAQLAAKLGVRLCMPGAAYGQSDLEAVYEKLALTVVPAVAGLTVMQSLAFGTPVVSNDDRYGQAPESGAIISGETGCFYATGDVAALADSIAYWLDVLKSDPEAVAQRCRTEVTERWSSDAQATAIVDAVVRWTPDRTVSHGR
jgi:glycosyltransferase involved in cell wall biosynthesis